MDIRNVRNVKKRKKNDFDVLDGGVGVYTYDESLVGAG
jgi:hypothetical protein